MSSILFVFCLAGNLVTLMFLLIVCIESYKEQEKRATRLALAGVIFSLMVFCLILFVPISIPPLTLVFAVAGVFGIAVCIPGTGNKRALMGTMGYAAGKVTRFHEAEGVFARTRSIPEGTEIYRQFYQAHPDWEEADKERRVKGILGKVGSIDSGYLPNVAMMLATDEMPDYLGPFARSEPISSGHQSNLDPVKNTRIIKRFANHLGADLVGICEINPAWVFSRRGEIHYGNWEDWGTEIKDLPKYAVVFLLEMNRDHVISAPHTPSAAESTGNYAKGAYISTILGRWLSYMGYRGIAEHSRNYDLILPPVAVDAGLGEVGRHGYLIAPRYGARVRIFATLTDMPLETDQPISIGVEEFCRKCMKCADSCPSRSITTGEMTVTRGVEKWKLDESSCYDYWSRVGTDCAICMAICPFSRPNNYFHKFIRRFVTKSPLAKKTFPHIDNFIYGKKWSPRVVPNWLKYPKRSEVEVYSTEK